MPSQTTKIMFLGNFYFPNIIFLSSRPSKDLTLRANTRFEP